MPDIIYDDINDDATQIDSWISDTDVTYIMDRHVVVDVEGHTWLWYSLYSMQPKSNMFDDEFRTDPIRIS